MNQLVIAYQRVLRKRNVFFNWLIVFLVFSWNAWTLGHTIVSFPLGLILSILLGSILLWYLYERTKKAENYLLHKLIEPGNVDHFLRTINHEMQSDDAVSVQDDISPMYLFITQTWIILFSTGVSFVRLVKDVVSVEPVFNTKQSKTSIHFTFSNGETFGCFCDNNQDEILKLFWREGRRTQS